MSFRCNVGVVYSEMSRQAFVAKAVAEGNIYRFQGSDGEVNWICGEAYLAVNGLTNILRRFGIKFDIIGDLECCPEILEYYHTIFCPNACRLPDQAIHALEAWLKEGRMLVVSGKSNLPKRLLGNGDDGKYIGESVIVGETVIVFTEPVFEYIGGILQGHVCIEPLRKEFGIDSTNFYIDILARRIKDILFKYGCKRLWEVQLKTWCGYDNVLVLRHDTDHSNDPSYLDYEIEAKIPASYAILPDKNREYYLSRIAPHSFLEASFHYTAYYWLPFLGMKPHKKIIAGSGMWRYINKAKKKYYIPCDTLHKHGSFFLYPETIEAMDYLYENMPETIGMGTMFRFSNIKYSSDRSFKGSYTVEHPDVSVPFWFPFKMMISSVEQHKILRGWDTTHFIEPSSYLVDLMFENSLMLPNGVYMLGFHPAHAKRDTFNIGGNFEWFLYAVNEAKKRGWWIANYRMVCQKLNDWESLVFRVEKGTVVLENMTDRDITDVMVSCGDDKEGRHVPLVKANSGVILDEFY